MLPKEFDLSSYDARPSVSFPVTEAGEVLRKTPMSHHSCATHLYACVGDEVALTYSFICSF